MTEKLIEHHLTQWAERSTRYSSDPDVLFASLDISLASTSAVNETGVLSRVHCDYCLTRLEQEKPGVADESDSENPVPAIDGDTSESNPEAEAITSIINTDMRTESIETMMGRIQRGTLDLNPPWQRKVVWGAPKQRALIKSILLGFPLPSIILFSPKGTSGLQVVDGKQRLTSILRFLQGEIPFPRVTPAENFRIESQGFDLIDCSNKLVTDDDFPVGAEERIRDTGLQISVLRDIDENTIYRIFTIYNSKATNLNAAEIRNAAYQEHEIHKKMVEITGEQAEESDWSDWTLDFRNVVGNMNPHSSRYRYLQFIERYLGYSRAHPELGRSGFMRLTTARSIKAFYDWEDGSSAELAEDVTYETKRVFDNCRELLPMGFTDLATGRFHSLRATNSMILMRIVLPLIDGNLIAEAEASKLMIEVSNKVGLPENQNSTSIWRTHTDSVHLLWDKLSKECKECLDEHHSQYLDRILPERWEK